MAHRYMCDICYRTHANMREARACERRCALQAAGEFVREEIRHYKRKGKHLAPGQAVAIGLSRARAAGIPVPRPRKKRR